MAKAVAAGSLDRRITIETNTPVTDGEGHETPSWSATSDRWASIVYGSGAERREAAANRATQSATVRLRADSVSRAIGTVVHRMRFDGVAWDIVSVAPFGRAVIDFGVVRAAENN